MHSMLVGYILWIFGFMGAHRFYFGRPISGTIYFFTLGLFFIGWIVDLFLIPGMDRAADNKYTAGRKGFNISWGLLVFLGAFGMHHFYLGQLFKGCLYLIITLLIALGQFYLAPLILIGIIYDYWTLNDQISEANRAA